ncbi:MAG TPA: methylthioribulose 1-phosphate dehydratase [Gemmatales bacterium]|nr:methylthioribulose 1-phosphate dehydratase [Gemmatales bacterium]
MTPHELQKLELIDIGSLFYQRQWSVGTSSNYSIRLREKPLRVLITASGKDKRALTLEDFVEVDDKGTRIGGGDAQPSAETMLHVVALAQPGIHAVLHTHSVWSTILSDRYASQGYLEITGYEMLKGLEGIKTHETTLRIKIFENTQDIDKLAVEVKQLLVDPAQPLRYGFLLRRHGLYTWGKDLFTARRHVEILEFLFEVQGRVLSMK